MALFVDTASLRGREGVLSVLDSLKVSRIRDSKTSLITYSALEATLRSRRLSILY